MSSSSRTIHNIAALKLRKGPSGTRYRDVWMKPSVTSSNSYKTSHYGSWHYDKLVFSATVLSPNAATWLLVTYYLLLLFVRAENMCLHTAIQKSRNNCTLELAEVIFTKKKTYRTHFYMHEMKMKKKDLVCKYVNSHIKRSESRKAKAIASSIWRTDGLTDGPTDYGLFAHRNTACLWKLKG